MRVTFLGTGAAMPSGHRSQSGLLVEANDDRLLIDCGSGVLNALQRTDAGYEAIDAVLFTHHHIDHVSDLDALLKARWLAGSTTLTVAGPPGTVELVDGLLELYEYMQDRLDLTVRNVEHARSLTGFDVEPMETRHSVQCFAYRITHGAETPPVTVSGDTEAFPELIEFADGSALLAHDCSFPDDVDVSNHPTPSQLGDALARATADIGRVYLSHLYPHTDGRHEEMLASISDHYDGDVEFARDGLAVTVTDTE